MSARPRELHADRANRAAARLTCTNFRLDRALACFLGAALQLGARATELRLDLMALLVEDANAARKQRRARRGGRTRHFDPHVAAERAVPEVERVAFIAA